ncbi:hypothetical protein GBB04_09675 [Bifidobacterium dentium]|uniref:Uncharacterized protein n=1 Tax=Bifidobacterium dentium TaxID=1689 RepID=A0A7J5TFQ4_9BIFI|nr:hypothetical protein GBA94_10450 [Bifidobacterium dentium]KAB7459567.1 hypothetical protein GBB04_09675 [Bifidobacterium dentium]KAB7462977.1 hypothetical protein GBB12_10325 [Bifidobacterium dentium]RYT61753.1 hypothetical protein EAI74_10145 [Bifidobacterium dentium]
MRCDDVPPDHPSIPRPATIRLPDYVDLPSIPEADPKPRPASDSPPVDKKPPDPSQSSSSRR